MDSLGVRKLRFYGQVLAYCYSLVSNSLPLSVTLQFNENSKYIFRLFDSVSSILFLKPILKSLSLSTNTF